MSAELWREAEAPMSPADKVKEPSMEEILASIRRIIAEEPEAEAAVPAPSPAVKSAKPGATTGLGSMMAQQRSTAASPAPEPELSRPAPKPEASSPFSIFSRRSKPAEPAAAQPPVEDDLANLLAEAPAAEAARPILGGAPEPMVAPQPAPSRGLTWSWPKSPAPAAARDGEPTPSLGKPEPEVREPALATAKAAEPKLTDELSAVLSPLTAAPASPFAVPASEPEAPATAAFEEINPAPFGDVSEPELDPAPEPVALEIAPDGPVDVVAEPVVAEVVEAVPQVLKPEPKAEVLPEPMAELRAEPEAAAADEPMPEPAFAAQPVEAVAADVSDAPSSGRSFEDTVSDMLRPLLKAWLNDNLPRMVAKALKDELADRESSRDRR